MRASVKTISHFRRGEKYAEKVFTYWARGAWFVFDRLNRIRPRSSFTPKWSDKPVLKSWEKTKPPLGWPRETDSLCPKCVPEIRKEILEGSTALSTLLDTEAPGQIKDRKSTRLNSSHDQISYAVFCLKKKKKHMKST